jgi:hypothetical protein
MGSVRSKTIAFSKSSYYTFDHYYVSHDNEVIVILSEIPRTLVRNLLKQLTYYRRTIVIARWMDHFIVRFCFRWSRKLDYHLFRRVAHLVCRIRIAWTTRHDTTQLFILEVHLDYIRGSLYEFNH